MNRSLRIFRRTLKAILWMFAVLILIIGLLIGSFYIFRDKIYNALVTELNTTLPGEIIDKKIHIAPLKFYPYLTFRLKNPVVYEHKMDVIDTAATPVIKVEKAYVGLYYKYLWQKKIKIGRIEARNGVINITTNKDSTMSLLYAFGDYKLHKKKKRVLEHLDHVNHTSKYNHK